MAMVLMFSCAIPWATLVIWLVLKVNLTSSFNELTFNRRRAIPRRVQRAASDEVEVDHTGGFAPWIEAQLYLALVISNLLFCLTTGQLDAWARPALVSSHCHPLSSSPRISTSLLPPSLPPSPAPPRHGGSSTPGQGLG